MTTTRSAAVSLIPASLLTFIGSLLLVEVVSIAFAALVIWKLHQMFAG